jgi:hypothetical protein
MNFEQKRNFNKLVKDKESTMLNLYKMSVICKNIINISHKQINAYTTKLIELENALITSKNFYKLYYKQKDKNNFNKTEKEILDIFIQKKIYTNKLIIPNKILEKESEFINIFKNTKEIYDKITQEIEHIKKEKYNEEKIKNITLQIDDIWFKNMKIYNFMLNKN